MDLGSFIYVHLCALGNSMLLVVTPPHRACLPRQTLRILALCGVHDVGGILEVPCYEVVLHRLDMLTCQKGPRVIAIHCKEAAINVGCCGPLIFHC